MSKIMALSLSLHANDANEMIFSNVPRVIGQMGLFKR